MLKLSDHLYIESQAQAEAEARRLREERRGRPRLEKRYAAARLNRQNADWVTEPRTANYDIYRDLKRLRARARQMAKDAPHFKRFLELAKSNVVGPAGMQLQCRARFRNGRLNATLNKQVEEVFWNWTHRETCSVTGKLDFAAGQRLFVETLLRDGEVLVRHMRLGSNPFGYAIKFLNVDYLDETYNEELRDGRRIIMSVEVDANDRPVAYWLTTPPSDQFYSLKRTRERIRVPAEEITHAFLVTEEETQIRGVTMFHAGLVHAKELHEYKGGVVRSAKIASYSMGFLKKTSADEIEFEGEEAEDGSVGDIEIDIEPLAMNLMPGGMELDQFDPKQPTQNHAEFSRSMLMDVAASLNLNYFSLAGDMSDVNYSSARVGLGEERVFWRMLQRFTATYFCREVFHRWLKAAVMSGQLVLPPAKYAEVMNPNWAAPGWRYVDPQKEVAANVEALRNGLTTYTDILKEQGIDIHEHLETLKQERVLMAAAGVKLEPAESGKPGPNKAAEDDDEPEEDENG